MFRYKILLACVSAFILLTCSVQAQCDFDPVISFLPPDDDGIYCPGGSITLSTQNSENSQWFYNFSDSNTGGTPLGFGNTSWIELDPGEWAVTYIYVESTINGCTEASPTVVWDAWVFNNPAISHPNLLDYCEGDEVTISNAFPGPTSFQWYLDGEVIEGATDENYSVNESGTYVLEVSYAECPFSNFNSGVGPTFTFNEPEIPTISQNGNSLMSTPADSYLWFIDGMATTEFDQTINGLTNGEYLVAVIDDNGCEASSEPYEFVFTGLEEIKRGHMSLYPNPTNSLFNIQLEGIEIGMVSIFNTIGEKVDVSNHASNLASIDISKLSPGIYTVLLNDHSITQKLSVN